MGQPVARQGDQIATSCLHQVQGQPPPPATPIAAPVVHPFLGALQLQLSTQVKIGGKPVALQGSQAQANGHVPLPPPGTSPIKFVIEPTRIGEIIRGSVSVNIEGKPVARIGDPVKTCSETPPPHGAVVPGPGAPAQVFVGG